jgi:transposase
MPSLSRRGVTYLGLDVSKNTIAVGILRAEEKIPDVETIAHDEPSVRRLVARVGPPSKLVACYEAGPTGYELYRLLMSMGVRCDVVAPSLIPTASGDRVKTDQRDGKRLARLHRAGELVSVRVPSRAEEGVRDLCRAGSPPSRIVVGPGSGWGRSCCATTRSGGAGRPGR